MSKGEDNPMAGIRVPSLRNIALSVVGNMSSGILDLSPLQRGRLTNYIEQALQIEMDGRLKRAIEDATARALQHLFRLMRDPGYQEKRRKARAAYMKVSMERRAKKKQEEAEARMNYSRRRFDVSKERIQ
jgi:hypothetical protein